jgi:RNA polymerase sigma-70 factor (ECF subfamily)
MASTKGIADSLEPATLEWCGKCSYQSDPNPQVRVPRSDKSKKTKNGGSMASNSWNAKITGFATEIPAVASRTEAFKAIYQEHQDRIYNLAFYLTDNEMSAEALSTRVFASTFEQNSTPSAEVLDRALLNELRATIEIGPLSLDEPICEEETNARRNIKRAVLERAVVSLPATERIIFLMHDVENYDHSRIARTLGINTDESKRGLHQARLALRRLVSEIKF